MKEEKNTHKKFTLWLTIMVLYSIYKTESSFTLQKDFVKMCLILDTLESRPISPEQLSSLQYKKKINHKVSAEEKDYNKIHSNKKRIVIEDAIICRLKKYRIMSDIFRNRLRKYDKISDIVVGRKLPDIELHIVYKDRIFYYTIISILNYARDIILKQSEIIFNFMS